MHGRALELICLKDRKRICTDCALFGDHKKHKIKNSLEALEEESYALQSMLSSMLRLKNISEEFISDNLIASNFEETLIRKCREKQKTITAELKSHAVKLHQHIDKIEKSCFEKINKFFTKVIEESLNQSEIIQDIVKNANEHSSLIENFLLKQSKIHSLNLKLVNLKAGREASKDELTFQADQIVSKLTNLQIKTLEKITEKSSQLYCKFDENILEKLSSSLKIFVKASLGVRKASSPSPASTILSSKKTSVSTIINLSTMTSSASLTRKARYRS